LSNSSRRSDLAPHPKAARHIATLPAQPWPRWLIRGSAAVEVVARIDEEMELFRERL
jgi:hypothetical protein